jgi:aryl-alcohol dehydrogenase-like predicted oxidoreductase
VIPAVRDLGIGLVPYSPLGRGFLSGTIRSVDDLAPDDFRRHSPRFQGENFARNLGVVDTVRALAEEKGATPSQLALAWVLAQDPSFVPIPGTKRVAYLEENVGALDVRLDADELRSIAQTLPQPAGARYDERGMQLVNG